MNLPIEHDFELNQGYAGQLDPFYVPGDYSEGKLYFEAKTSQSLSAAASFTKANASAGGSDDLLASSYLHGVTAITPLMYYSDTQSITNDYLYYNIVFESGTSRTILMTGKIKMNFTVVADADAVEYSMDLAKHWIFKLETDGTVTDILTAANFAGTLTASLSGRVVTITSTEDEVTESWQVARTTGISIGYKEDINTFKVHLTPNWNEDNSYVIIDLYKLQGA